MFSLSASPSPGAQGRSSSLLVRAVRRVAFRLAFLAAFLFAFGAATRVASAAPAEIGELPPGAPGVGRLDTKPSSDAKGPTLIVPHDVPVVLPTAREAIPPVPASYVTKDLGWLELSYPPSAAERVQSIIQDAEAVKVELSSHLGQPVLQKVTVRVAPTVADMARLAPQDAPPPDYASGVAYHGLHLVLLSMLAPHGGEAVDLDEVFRHELAHVALEDAVQGKHVPVWFNEGLAIYLSGELAVARTKTLWNATLSGTLIPLSELDRSFPRDNFEVSIAYAESADFMRFLTRKSDRLRFASMIERVKDGQPFERAIAEAYGSDLRRLEFEWHGDLEHRFSVIPVLTGGGLIWVLVIAALGAAYVRRRRRARAILARWEREEAIEDAMLAKREAERAAITAVLTGNAGMGAKPITTSRPTDDVAAPAQAAAASASIRVDDRGRWHTLH